MPNSGPESTNLVRRRVINVIGHELRTPVTTVRGLAELLLDASEEEARDVIIPALIRNARRTEDLLDDLLIASDVSTALPVDEATEIDLAAIAAEVVEGTAVRVEGSPAGPVLAHPDIVIRALRHLVTNAEKYHDAPPSLRFESDAAHVTAVVVTPIDGEVANIDLSFEVFFRGEEAVTRSQGIGVGLPAARALARVEGGEVEIEQEPGRFVTRLTLPRAR